jgi:hypothetical protein
LLLLPAGWDSYRAAVVAPRAVAAALTFLYSALGDTTEPPTVVPTNAGGIDLEWHLRQIDLVIGISDAGEIHVSFEDLATGVAWEHDATSDLGPLAAVIDRLS